MERRKDTPFQGSRLPRDYVKLVEDVFNKNFSKFLIKEKNKKEIFLAYGEVYPDELILALSLKNPKTLWMTTCYASVDYPPPQSKTEAGNNPPSDPTDQGSFQAVEIAVNQCVDAVASFFQTFFNEERPIDYDEEYRQNWTILEIDKNTRVYMRINRDNLELESQADDLLAQDDEDNKKKKLH